ncbi:MAG: glycosyltransferase [Janthinobacterium lividum]
MRRTPSLVVYSMLSLAFMTLVMANHLQYVVKFTNLAVCYTFMFLHLVVKTTASLAAPHHTVRPGSDLDSLRVDIVVPVYNEDPRLLAAGVRSFAAQQRLPRAVWLVDDGSLRNGEPFHVLVEPEVVLAIGELRSRGVVVHEMRQLNSGKREAQAAAFARSDAEVFITVDSDTVLRPDTVQKIVIPFSDPRTTSVGGVAYGQNHTRSLLTRTIEMGFVMSFIQSRLAEGAFGSVRVNCGILAAYRGDVVRENLHRFLGQRFLGVPVRAGDDRCLTFFAKERGRTEFQPEAIAYSALPESLGHLLRQRMRWARSWCWGTLWLLRRPVFSADFLFTMTQALGFVMYVISLTVGLAGTITGAISASLLLNTLLTAVGIGMVSHFRYVVVARQDESLRSRLLTWMLSPLSSLLYLFLLQPLYLIAIVRPRPQQNWGTRKVVEVSLHDKAGQLGVVS